MRKYIESTTENTKCNRVFYYKIRSLKYLKQFADNGCGHTWDLTLVKGFNRGKKDVKKLYYSKTH